MIFNYNGNEYNVIIEKKKTTRGTYIRVKEDVGIYITSNIRTSDKKIIEFINKSRNFIEKAIDKMELKKEDENKFQYLGFQYDIVRINEKGVQFGNNKVFISNKMDSKAIDKWYRNEALRIFEMHFELAYKNFNRLINKPSLHIRKMKTRWGVCNVTKRKITLNLELMKKPICCLDYVIVHELAHLVEANHSKRFWAVVEENYPNYKEVKKILKE